MTSTLPVHAIEAGARKLFALRAGNDAWPTAHDETRAAYRRLAAETVAAALAAVDPTLLLTEHLITVTDDGTALQHPLACRPNLLDCQVHKLVDSGGEWLRDELDVGRFPIEVVKDAPTTLLRVGDRVIDLHALGEI